MKESVLLSIAIVCLTAVISAQPANALDDEHWHRANEAVKKGITYLRSTQQENGSWTPQPGPAITALAMGVMLDRPDIDASDPQIAKALDYVLSKAKPDGGIHDGFLQNYNTAICLSALSRVNDKPTVAQVISAGQRYLKQLQWSNQTAPDGETVDKDHVYYGGAGYGKHGRPDMSNTQIMLQGLYDSGLDCNDPAFQRALVFITRCQGTESNKKLGDKIVQDGGFIYATCINKDNLDKPESKAGTVTVHLDGKSVTQLRTYGSMTYAGFKSYIYANLDRDDQRVVDAYSWIRSNFTLTHNPGMPEKQKLQGHFYYLMTMSRALDAWGSSSLTLSDQSRVDWANALIDQLVRMQAEDGSWTNTADRWMEGDPNLVTAYALIALTHAMR